jgi:transposase
MLERWEGLTRFVDDPRISLDNNAAERALRGPVVGRKNHDGSRSLRGTQVAALFYTLCETAKLVSVDPHAYLLRALYIAIVQPGAITYPEDLLHSHARPSPVLTPHRTLLSVVGLILRKRNQ